VGAAELGYEPYVEVAAVPVAAGADVADPVVLLPVAAAWNAAKLLPGLIANTMPCWQWFA